jgi:hypothetical protein
MAHSAHTGKIRSAFIILLYLLIQNMYCFAEESSNRSFRIAQVKYSIVGKTKISALEKDLSWDLDRVFSSVYQLDAYLQKQRQQLINKKVFKSVLTNYHVVNSEGSILDVEVIVDLEDSWTMIPLPIYTYDNNLGLIMGLGMDYKNVGGTLSDLDFSSYYSDTKSEITGNWTDFRIGSHLYDFRFNQLWETVKSTDSNGNIDLEYSYIQSEIRMSIEIPIIPWLNYSARPILRWPYSYSFMTNTTGESNSSFSSSGLNPAYNHIIEWDRVNWIGSLRQGINASIENELEYSTQNNQLILWLDGHFKTYIYTPIISYNLRVSSFYYYNDFKINAADRLRGVLDYKLSGEYGFFLNQNFPFNVVSMEKIGDLQLSPFIDIGYVGELAQEFTKEDIQYTTGLSIIVFPALLPSISLNIDTGINLQDTSETEISISSTLYF